MIPMKSWNEEEKERELLITRNIQISKYATVVLKEKRRLIIPIAIILLLWLWLLLLISIIEHA